MQYQADQQNGWDKTFGIAFFPTVPKQTGQQEEFFELTKMFSNIHGCKPFHTLM